MSCEAFQIAHEVWAHGGEAELSRDDVATHIAGCAACSSYVRRSSEATDMTAIPFPASFDSEALRRRVDRKLFAMRIEGPATLVVGLALGVVCSLWQGSAVPLVGIPAVCAVVYARGRRRLAALQIASETSSGLARALHAQLVKEFEESSRSLQAALIFLPGAAWILLAGHTALPVRIGSVALCVVWLANEAVRRRRLKTMLASWRA